MTLFLGLMAKAKAAGSDFSATASEYLVRVKDLLYFDPVKRSRRGPSYEQVDIWSDQEGRRSTVFADLTSVVIDLIDKSDRLISAATDVVA